MIKFKHFLHIEGSTEKQVDVLKDAEDFVNNNKIDPVEISHSFTPFPHRALSVFISYVEVDKAQKKAISEAVGAPQKSSKGKSGTTPAKTKKKPSTGSKKAK